MICLEQTKDIVPTTTEGQQVESFKYVRKADKPEKKNFLHFSSNRQYEIALNNWQELIKWQEVEEPEEDNPKYMKPYYIDGGYAGEEFDRKEYESEHTKFQEELKSGVILLELTPKE